MDLLFPSCNDLALILGPKTAQTKLFANCRIFYSVVLILLNAGKQPHNDKAFAIGKLVSS
jgi:hypothetical protein